LKRTKRELLVIQPDLFQGVPEWSPDALYMINTDGPYVVDLVAKPHLTEPFERLMKPDARPVQPDEWIRRFTDFRDIHIITNHV
jgi:hypothetical protein